MLRGPLVLAALLEVADAVCPDCTFDVTALEEFSVDYHAVRFTQNGNDFTTGPMSFWTDSGSSVALNVRNLQAKWNNQGNFGTPLQIGPLPLSGQPFQEEIHINGATGQASVHIASSYLNMCFQLDGLPNFAQMQQATIAQDIAMAEQAGPGIAQQYGTRVTVDGVAAVGFEDPSGEHPGVWSFTDSTHPLFIGGPALPSQRHFYDMLQPRPSEDEINHVGMKIDNYANTVGNQFDVRACEVQSQMASQALLAANPTAKQFMASRLALYQGHLQALLRPFGKSFIPLEIEDLMVPVAHDCDTDELAQIPPNAWSTMQAAAFSVCAFVTGIAVTFVALRKKPVTAPDDYHSVAA